MTCAVADLGGGGGFSRARLFGRKFPKCKMPKKAFFVLFFQKFGRPINWVELKKVDAFFPHQEFPRSAPGHVVTMRNVNTEIISSYLAPYFVHLASAIQFGRFFSEVYFCNLPNSVCQN